MRRCLPLARAYSLCRSRRRALLLVAEGEDAYPCSVRERVIAKAQPVPCVHPLAAGLVERQTFDGSSLRLLCGQLGDVVLVDECSQAAARPSPGELLEGFASSPCPGIHPAVSTSSQLDAEGESEASETLLQ